MKSILCRVLLVLFPACAIVVAQTPQPAPQSRGFSIDDIDKSADPCTDFYQYACGNWMKTVKIPADRPDWDSFGEVEERNLLVLKDILEKAAAGGSKRDAIDQKIGDFYGACMDEGAIETKGLGSLKPELARITAAGDKQALIDAVAPVHLLRPNPSLRFSPSPHLHTPLIALAPLSH